MDESAPACLCSLKARPASLPSFSQGRTLVHFSAQRKRFLWDRGCIQGFLRGCVGGVRGYHGTFRVCFVSETAQVELKWARVQAPAFCAAPGMVYPKNGRPLPP